MEIVQLVKRKRPVGSGRWNAYALAADEHGAWVYTPAHSTYVGDNGKGGVASCEVAQDSRGVGRHSLVLLPSSGWYVARWLLGAHLVVSIDISTPPQWSGSQWSFDDLELDPFLLSDGTFGVEDEDEFEMAREAGLISDNEYLAGLQAVAWLESRISDVSSPFVQLGRHRLLDAVALGLPPLR